MIVEKIQELVKLGIKSPPGVDQAPVAAEPADQGPGAGTGASS